VLAKIAEMEQEDRALAEGLPAVVQAHALELDPRIRYGISAYARDGKPVVFSQGAETFGSRYATPGFSVEARLDDGEM